MTRTELARRATTILIAAAAAVPTTLLAVAVPAAAQFPGDDGRLAVAREGGSSDGIWTMNPDGSDQQLIWAGVGVRTPEWSPDGQRLAVSVSGADPGDGTSFRQVWTVAADGSDRRQLTTGVHRAFEPTWSPDGMQIAYTTSEDDILVVGVPEGGTGRLVVDSECIDDVVWSPDGATLYYTDCTSPDGMLPGGDVWSVPAAGGSPTRLTDGPERERMLDVSPDGRQLAVTGIPAEGGNSVLWLMGTDGSGRELLLSGRNEAEPTFSPDGGRLTVLRVPAGLPVDNAPRRVHLVDLASREVTEVLSSLPEEAVEYTVSWQRAGAAPPAPETYTYRFGSTASLTTYTPVSTVPAGGLQILGQYQLDGYYTLRPEADSPYTGARLFTVTEMRLTGQEDGPVFELPAGSTGQLVCWSTHCEPSVPLQATRFHGGATASLRTTGIAAFGPMPSGDPAAPSGFDWNRSENSFTQGGFGLYVNGSTGLEIAAAVRGPATLPPPQDTVAPTVAFTSPAEGVSVPYGATVTLDWSCEDDVAVAGCSAVTKLGGVDGAHGSTPVTTGTVVDSTQVPAGPYALIVTARDLAGNETVAVRNYVVSPIDITPRLTSPASGASFPFGSQLTVRFSCGDPTYPVDRCTATHDGAPVADGDVLPPATAGWHTITVTAVHDPDGATRSATRIYRYVGLNRDGTHPGGCCALDATAPTVDLSPADGAVLGHGTSPAVQYSCADAAGIQTCSGALSWQGGEPVPVTSGTTLDTSAPGRYVLTVTAEDRPGNRTVRTATFTVAEPGDTTAEVTGGETVSTGTTATATAPVQTTVSVPVGTSGTLRVDAQPAGAAPAGFALFGQQLVIEGPEATAAAPYELSFRVDQSALGGVAPADVQVWRNGVAVSGCTDPDAAVPDPCVAFRGFTPESGDGGDALVTVRTSRFSTWTLGALDYDLTGPTAPVDVYPVVNTTKAGSAVPVKFRLGGDRGLDVFAAGFPRTVTASCTGGSDEVETTVTAAASELTYDRSSDTYTYKWKSLKTARGCVDLVLRFRDGSELRARFNLR